MIKSSKQTENKELNYQYQYDSNGKTVGVFIPIKEWKTISKKYTGLAVGPLEKNPSKEKIKKGIVSAMHEVESYRQGSKKLQNAKDFIGEMRKELK